MVIPCMYVWTKAEHTIYASVHVSSILGMFYGNTLYVCLD